ncbi:MAG: DUF6506 family protein [Deltaproteobacteria bacterium]|nr:DUF6506 family protein [Deltaproteobacteria bacterium]
MTEAGVAAMELCGALGPKPARNTVEAAQGKAAAGRAVRNPDQDGGFEKFFARR